MAQLNIKNAETVRLAQDLSRLTGEKMTVAVTRALRARLDAVMARRRAAAPDLDAILAIADRCAALPVRDARHPDDILYDADGLPKDGV